ncbi:hypothetical protein [Streptomyces zaomyceticus]|uniref:hypothetical protein n=1 Tax=Streptomyces zaomyceticus TaxID=68286 RepID=UPI002E0F1542|nr:hypothetical protein OG237_12760 [Streptomyces zaomyceticus]
MAALLITLTDCLVGPARYYEGTGVHDATTPRRPRPPGSGSPPRAPRRRCARTGRRADATLPPPDGGDPPTTYSRRFSVDRDDRRGLVLFFHFGDPDAGNTYVMTRRPTATTAP